MIRRIINRLRRSKAAAPTPEGPVPRSKVHAYWSQPWDGANDPELYLKGAPRSALLAQLMADHLPEKTSSVLELGCNVGRNLEALRKAGYENLTAIEISADALALLRKTFPELGEKAALHNGKIEDEIKRFGDASFDAVFTLAVLEHIHPESEWIFAEMARVTRKRLIVIEDEACVSWRHFPRNYAEIFSSHGLNVVHRADCADVEGLSASFKVTVLEK